MCLSEPQTAVAMTLMRTSAWPGVGTGTVLTSVAEGPGAAFVLTTAVMVEGRVGPLEERPDFGLGFFVDFAINTSKGLPLPAGAVHQRQTPGSRQRRPSRPAVSGWGEGRSQQTC